MLDDQGNTLAIYEDAVPAVVELDAAPAVRSVTIRTVRGELVVPVPPTGT